MADRYLRNPKIPWHQNPAQRDAILNDLRRGEKPNRRGWVTILDKGQRVELNLIAGEIWVMCDGSKDLSDISRDLADRYDAPYTTILSDVQSFVAKCTPKGWIVPKKPADDTTSPGNPGRTPGGGANAAHQRP